MSNFFLYYFTMNYKTHKSTGRRVITLALATLLVNAAFADTSSGRLTAYKANRLIPQDFNLPTQSAQSISFDSGSLSWSSAPAQKGFSDISYAELKELMQQLLKTAKTDAASAESLHEAFDYLMGLMNGTETSTDLSLTAFGPFVMLFGTEFNSPSGGDEVALVDFAIEQGWTFDLTRAADAISYCNTMDTSCLAAFAKLAPHLADPNVKGVDNTLINVMAQCSSLQLGKNAVLPSIALTDSIILKMASNGSFVGADFSNVSNATWNHVNGSSMAKLVKAPGYSNSKENAYIFNNTTFRTFEQNLLPAEKLNGSWAIKVRGSDLKQGSTFSSGLAFYQVTEVDNDIVTIEQIGYD